MISQKTIERLSLYRHILLGLKKRGLHTLFSHELARAAGNTAAQIRRDFMTVDCPAKSAVGYEIDALIRAISSVLDAPTGERAALVGMGNLGRALLAHVQQYRPRFTVTAAFDINPSLHGEVVANCQCYPIDEMMRVVREFDIRIGILTVPDHEAQRMAEKLSTAGVHGILNFAAVALRVPDTIHVEDIHLMVSLEKASFFARMAQEKAAPVRE